MSFYFELYSIKQELTDTSLAEKNLELFSTKRNLRENKGLKLRRIGQTTKYRQKQTDTKHNEAKPTIFTGKQQIFQTDKTFQYFYVVIVTYTPVQY